MKLVLIDAHAILHRAYHALPPLTNKDGAQTNAVYGFMTMLLTILDNLKPDYLITAFDRKEPTFRKQTYTQYQAKRPVMEGNLSEQIPLLHELLDHLNIAHYDLAGYEADDIIGSLAAQAAKIRNSKFEIRNVDTVIVSGDRDFLQLVNKNIKVCVPVKGLGETKIYDEGLIKKEFGVEPSQWVDVKALKGDPSDNYPGVRGIGPKTAEKLIREYGTLENLFAKLDELAKFDSKVAKKLAEGAEDAGMGKKLATIMTDVPIKLDLEKAETAKTDWLAGSIFMQNNLGFRSIVDRIQKSKLKSQNDNSKVKSENEQLGLI